MKHLITVRVIADTAGMTLINSYERWSPNVEDHEQMVLFRKETNDGLMVYTFGWIRLESLALRIF